MERHPQFKGRPIYLTGESYAGHYIPAFAYWMHFKANKDLNLKGVAIGNGWVDPFYQYGAYKDFAAENNLLNIGQTYLLHFTDKICELALISGVPLLALIPC